MVFFQYDHKCDFLEKSLFGHNFWKNHFWYTKFGQKVSYNNSKLPTKWFLERKNRPIVAIFHLFFVIDNFCQPQLTNPSRFEHKSYFDRDFFA